MATSEISASGSVAWASYQRMRTRLTGRLNRELFHETGLSEADFEILIALTDSPDESMRALALRCGLEWEKSRLSHQLRRMEQRGLLTREECTEDSRGSVVRVTDTGRTLVAAASLYYHQAIRRYVLDVLSRDQLDALGAIAETVLRHLDESHHA